MWIDRWFAWYPVKTEDTQEWLWFKWIYKMTERDSFGASTCAFERVWTSYFEMNPLEDK
jgi:hypothetical protein